VIKLIQEQAEKENLRIKRVRLLPYGSALGVSLFVENLYKEDWIPQKRYIEFLEKVEKKTGRELAVLGILPERDGTSFKVGDRIEIYCEFVVEGDDPLRESEDFFWVTEKTALAWVPGRITQQRNERYAAEMERVTCNKRGEPAGKTRFFTKEASDVRKLKEGSE